ncbi:MAG: hypothetical protein E7291_07295 [Lachnospiraceae bacterium]|nr:hypothetical protein [Lachnospiraceae bacterium]
MKVRQLLKAKLNNSGAALVTVIVVIAFVSVLVTVMLYMAGVNYYMKSADKEVKDSFYKAETAMENIRAGLMIEAKNAYQSACQTTMAEFLAMTPSIRQQTYYKNFTDSITSIFNTHITANGGTPDGLEIYLQNLSGYGTNLTTTAAGVEVHEDDGYVVIRDVNISYTLDNYLSIITTDFVIKAPEADWGTDSSLDAWVPGEDPAEVLTREEISMADCVIYMNWKKE